MISSYFFHWAFLLVTYYNTTIYILVVLLLVGMLEHTLVKLGAETLLPFSNLNNFKKKKIVVKGPSSVFAF